MKRGVKRSKQQKLIKNSTKKRIETIDLTINKEIHIQHTISDDSNDEKEFISINNFEIQFPPFSSSKRRKDFYTSDSNDKKVNEKIGNKIDSDETDENVNIKKIVEKIVKEIIEKVLHTRNNRKIKKSRISLPYYKEMEDKRKKDLKYKTKPKVVRYLSKLI
jgi:hypothetical protein